MTEGKTKVTLIGTHLAKPGLEFIYEGELSECIACRVRRACNNLQPGRRYRITAVRSASRHDCTVHAGGTLAIEVVESPIVALVSADMAIVNSRIQYEFSCSKLDCRSRDLCRPEGIIEGEKYTIGEILGNAPDVCLKGRSLKLVELRSS
jgi:uncharacterized protein (UPF0179 family)